MTKPPKQSDKYQEIQFLGDILILSYKASGIALTSGILRTKCVSCFRAVISPGDLCPRIGRYQTINGNKIAFYGIEISLCGRKISMIGQTKSRNGEVDIR